MGTPIARGVLAAVLALASSLGIVVIPALAAQLAGATMSAIDALVIALNIVVLGHGGAVTLDTGVVDGPVHLMPLGLTGVFVLICALGMRRAVHALALVERNGRLRVRAMREVSVATGVFALVYALGVGLFAGLGRSTELHPIVVSAIVSGALVGVVGGGLGVLWAIRREARAMASSTRILDLLPSPFGPVVRGALVALLGLFALGMLAVSIALLVRMNRAGALMDGLDPGIVGGTVLTLLQLALLPLLAVWALAVLLGGTVTVGTGTALSLGGSSTGVLPALPLLGALPQPGIAPQWLWALLVLPTVLIGLGAYVTVREARDLPQRERITAWVLFPLVVFVVTLLLAGLATAGIGDARLVQLGPVVHTVAGPLAGLCAVAMGVVLVAFASPLPAWVRRQVAALRQRVEREEAREAAESSSGPEEPADPVDRG